MATSQSRPTIILAVVICLVGICPTRASEPSLRLTVTQSGLNAAVAAVLPEINTALQKPIVLPARTLKVHVPLMGETTVNIESITISGVQIPSLDLHPVAPSGLGGGVSGLSISVDVPFSWRQDGWPHIKGHNSVTAGGVGGDISMALAISANAAGQPSVSMSSDSCSFSHFDIKVHGRGGWIFNIFLSLFNHELKDAVDKAVATAMKTEIPNVVNKALSEMKFVTTIFGGASRVDLDYGLHDVTSTAAAVSFGDLLSVKDHATGAACPLAPVALPEVSPLHPTNYLQIVLADDFVSCLGWVQYANKALQLQVPHSDMPNLLNTTFWKGSVPGLPAALPDAAMALDVTLHAAPGIHTTAAKGIVGSADLALDFSVEGASGAQRHSHTLDASVSFGASVAIVDVGKTATLMFKVTELSLAFKELDSDFGPVNVAGLNGLLDIILPLIKDAIDGLLAKGIPLPGSPTGAGVKNPEVDMGNGYLAISFDFVAAEDESNPAAPAAAALRGSALAA